MPRTYKRKGVQTHPDQAGEKNFTPELLDKFAEKDKNADEITRAVSDAYRESLARRKKRTSAWTREILENEINDYFDFCARRNLKPCKAGIQVWLSVTRTQYYDWETKPSIYGDISYLIQQANYMMEMQYISKGEQYPTMNTFLLKTSHGHVDASKLDVTTNGESISVNNINDLINKLGFGE